MGKSRGSTTKRTNKTSSGSDFIGFEEKKTSGLSRSVEAGKVAERNQMSQPDSDDTSMQPLEFQPRPIPPKERDNVGLCSYICFLCLFVFVTVDHDASVYHFVETAKQKVSVEDFLRIEDPEEYYEWLGYHFFPGLSYLSYYRPEASAVGMVGLPRLRQTRASACEELVSASSGADATDWTGGQCWVADQSGCSQGSKCAEPFGAGPLGPFLFTPAQWVDEDDLPLPPVPVPLGSDGLPLPYVEGDDNDPNLYKNQAKHWRPAYAREGGGTGDRSYYSYEGSSTQYDGSGFLLPDDTLRALLKRPEDEFEASNGTEFYNFPHFYTSVSDIEESGWLDGQTTAIFHDFTLVNPGQVIPCPPGCTR